MSESIERQAEQAYREFFTDGEITTVKCSICNELFVMESVDGGFEMNCKCAVEE